MNRLVVSPIKRVPKEKLPVGEENKMEQHKNPRFATEEMIATIVANLQSGAISFYLADALIKNQVTILADHESEDHFMVNYNMTLSKMVKMGNYEFAWYDRKTRFYPNDAKGIYMIGVDYDDFSIKHMLPYFKELDLNGKRPWTAVETLFVVRKNRKRMIGNRSLAMGSTWLNDAGKLCALKFTCDADDELYLSDSAFMDDEETSGRCSIGIVHQGQNPVGDAQWVKTKKMLGITD